MADSIVFARNLEPSAERHPALDQRMRTRLADSLSYIGEACTGSIPFDAQHFQGALERIRVGTVPAQVFAAYGDLVLALDDDDLARAEALFVEIADLVSGPLPSGMFHYRDPAECGISERYHRWMNTMGTINVVPVTEEEAGEFSALLAATWRLLEAGAPALAAETRLLAREIVVARAEKNESGMIFDGVSSFLLWGAILLNMTTHKTRFALLQALVHESGHNLLFGLCADGPLVENADEERYASPLRVDLRPMDGVVHATYVTARMHMAVRHLLASGKLTAEERREAEADLALHKKGFASGLSVIKAHGRLTPLGMAVLTAAEAHMKVREPA